MDDPLGASSGDVNRPLPSVVVGEPELVMPAPARALPPAASITRPATRPVVDAVTWTVADADLPSSETVTFAVPADTPSTEPELFTVRMLVFDDVHVNPS